MKKWIVLLLGLGLGVVPLFAQNRPYDPAHSLGISFRSQENPYYWKNSPPYPGYWQQDVDYTMEVRLNTKTHTIAGRENLNYYNNSPDTLAFVYFHLYQNSFKKGSYLDLLRRTNGDYSIAKLSQKEEGGTRILKITDGLDRALKVSIDNTIMKVVLNRPLLPGDSTRFKIEFTTHFSKIPHRMKYNPSHGFDQFTATQWYPKISVYDRRFGWTTDQHLGHEFYGEFGTFDVKITLPQEFIVGATGYLLNRNEVLPPELMEKLKIENFKNKPFGEKPSVIVPHVDGKTKTWHYRAVNVHDFAWTADPSYRIGEVTLKSGVRVYAFAREWKASKWQDAAKFAAAVIQTYSRDIGPYGYHKMIVADADEGMEYPMITMDGGESPRYYGLFAHEEGHNWFYGMLGNNETYRAFEDEGFTQFLTSWSMERLVGRKIDQKTKKFPFKGVSRDRYRNFMAYLGIARLGYDAQLTTHSDWFENSVGYNSYRLVYYKTFTMLYNLQYVLGDSLFLKTLQKYFATWKFRHPYELDFRNVAIHTTHKDLNWFFDEWLNFTWSLDYAVKGVKNKKTDDGYLAEILVKRKGQMIMPIDLELTLADGSKKMVTIPVDYWSKSVPGIEVLPNWYGIGNLNRTYLAKVKVPSKVKSAQIDPSGRLGDWYRLDNRSGILPKIKVAKPFRSAEPPLDAYLLQWRPNAWFNDVDGVQLGIHLSGAYLNRFGMGDHQMKFSAYYAVRSKKAPVGYRFSYRQPLRKLGKSVFFQLTSESGAGLSYNAFSFEQNWNKYVGMSRSNQLKLTLEFFNQFDRSYLWNRGLWSESFLRHSGFSQLRVDFDRRRRFRRGTSRIHANATFGFVGQGWQFSKWLVTLQPTIHLGSRYNLRLRGAAGFASGDIPAQSQFYLTMASPAKWIRNPWYRAKGTFPVQWEREGRVQPYGGGNLRGYQAQFVSGKTSLLQGGNSLSAFNAEFSFPNYLRFVTRRIPVRKMRQVRFDRYLFYDAATVWHASYSGELIFEKPVLQDAGIGFSAQMQSWKFHLDFPVWLSHPKTGEKNVKFRWVLGMDKNL